MKQTKQKTSAQSGHGTKKRAKRNKPSKTQHHIDIHANPNAAGIDIGAEQIVVAVPPSRDPEPVRTFDSFTGGLVRLRDWLLENRIGTVAMESTGNYWINCYDILEQAGIEVFLVNARHVKGVPGKKTDVCDAQWLQQLHAAGLLRKSFRPAQEILSLRYMARHRDSLVKDGASCLHRIQKLLTEMNIQLHHVISDIDGVSGQAIIKGILAGERSPEVLASLRNGRCQTSESRIIEALRGNYRPEYIYILGQLQEQWEQIRSHIVRLDDEIERQIGSLPAAVGDVAQTPAKPQPRKAVRKQAGKNAVPYDYRKESLRCYGVDLMDVEGVGPGMLTALLSEIGPRENLLGAFKTADGFCAWLGVCPCNAITGGKVIKTGTRKTENRVAAALRLAAFGLDKSKSQMGQFCRRMKGKLGKAQGITATAHKLARIIYAMIANRVAYDEAEAFKTNPGSMTKRIHSLASAAEKLGFKLVPTLDTAMS